MVWVFILVRPKFPLRVRRFDQNSIQKVFPCSMMVVELWPLVWRVKRLNSWFLAISLVKNDIRSSRPSSIVWSGPDMTNIIYYNVECSGICWISVRYMSVSMKTMKKSLRSINKASYKKNVLCYNGLYIINLEIW